MSTPIPYLTPLSKIPILNLRDHSPIVQQRIAEPKFYHRR